MRKKIILSLTVVLLLASVLITWHYFSSKTDQRILNFQNDFTFQMSGEPKITLSEEDYGFTDGRLVYVFQLTEKDMKTALAENNMVGWSRLPIRPYLLIDKLTEQIAFEEKTRAYYHIYLSARSGYYRIQNDKKQPVVPLFPFDRAYDHVAGAVIDTKKNRIFYFRWDD